MWHVAGNQVAHNWLRQDPVRVLYEFDGPKIFLCKDIPGNLYLAYQCDESEELLRFLVVPFSEDLERRLTSGEMNVRDALTRAKAWLFDFGNDWSPLSCWEINVDDLPPGVLPEPGVMLWPHLQPVMNRVTLRPSAAETPITFASLPSPVTCFAIGVG
jgi:hypothetical protein